MIVTTLLPQNITVTGTTSLAPYTTTFISSYLTTIYVNQTQTGPTVVSTQPASTYYTTIVSSQPPVTETSYTTLPAGTFTYYVTSTLLQITQTISEVSTQLQNLTLPPQTQYLTSLITFTLPASSYTTEITISETIVSTYVTQFPASTIISTLVQTSILPASTSTIPGPTTTVSGPTETQTSISVVFTTYLTTYTTTLPASTVTYTSISVSVQDPSTITQSTTIVSTVPGTTITTVRYESSRTMCRRMRKPAGFDVLQVLNFRTDLTSSQHLHHHGPSPNCDRHQHICIYSACIHSHHDSISHATG